MSKHKRKQPKTAAAKARARSSAGSNLTLEDRDTEPIGASEAPVTNGAQGHRQASVRDPYVYLILILPILVLARNTSYIYTAAGYIDPWVYYGYMKHLVTLKQMFPSTYYGSRLSWLLPGAMVHAILSPVPATYVLHLAVFFTAVFSTYWLLKEALDRRIAVLSAICLAMYPYFWEAVGWDYVDGAGIAYYLLTMALVFAAAKAKNTRNRWLLVCAGMAYAGMIYSNIVWMIFSPSFLALYLWPISITVRTALRRTFGFLLWFGVGSLVVTVVLGVANRFLDGSFWFYAPSLLYALSTVGTKNPWKDANYGWIKIGYWLILPGLACLGALLICIRTSWKTKSAWRDMRVFFALNLLYGAALLIYMELVGRPMLQLVYYASYLIPCSILAFGAAVFESASSFRESRFRLTIGGAVFCLLCIWGFITLPAVLTIVLKHPTVLLFAGMGITFVGMLFARRGLGVILGLAGLTVFSVSSRAVNLPPGNNGGTVFRRISSGMEMVENARGDQPVRFWFDNNDPHSAEFHSLNSCYLWGYTAIGYHFPLLETATVGNGAFIVIPSSKPDVAAEAAGAFTPRGSTARFLGKERDESGGQGYWISFFRVEPDAEHMAPLQVSFDPNGIGHLETSSDTTGALAIPNPRWMSSGSASVQMTPEGVQIESSASSADSGSTYADVMVTQSGVYRFVLKYRSQHGNAIFEARSPENSRLDQISQFYRAGPDMIKESTVKLDANQLVRLVTSTKQESARYVIEELRAYRLTDPAPTP